MSDILRNQFRAGLESGRTQFGAWLGLPDSTAAEIMAGAGFDNTFVRLVADPQTTINSGRIEAEGAFGQMVMEMRGKPMPDNPKTSAVTALSLIYALNKETSRFVI